MKFKTLLFILLLPFASQAAITNVYDRVLIRNDFQFTGGTVGPFKVMTSDAVGYQSPQSILYDAAGLESVEFQLRVLDSSAGVSTLDWENSQLKVSGGVVSIDWANWIARDQNAFLSINWDTRQLYDNNEFPAAKWNIRQLCDTDEVASVSWQNRTLHHSDGTVTVNYNSLQLRNTSDAVVVDWSARALYDSADVLKVDWQSAILKNSLDTEVFNWENRTLSGGAWAINGNVTLGVDASSAHTFNGSTWTIANNPQINTDVLKIPSAGGTLTNGTSFTSLNVVQGSNVVATTTDGTYRLSSGTNVLGILDINQGAGTLQTRAMFTASTNTPAGINPSCNVINTNGTQRLFVNISVAYAVNSGTFLWTSTAQGPKNRFFTPTAGVTNFVSGWVQPNALWTISNYVGTATCIPGEGHLEAH